MGWVWEVGRGKGRGSVKGAVGSDKEEILLRFGTSCILLDVQRSNQFPTTLISIVEKTPIYETCLESYKTLLTCLTVRHTQCSI